MQRRTILSNDLTSVREVRLLYGIREIVIS